MAKRFTETEIWSDPWYRKLPLECKVLWKFLLDRSDAAGFWKKDFEMASFLCGFEVTHEYIDKLNIGKIRVADHGEHFEIVDFVKFQYGTLSEDCKPHKPVLKLLDNYRLKGYGKGFQTLQEQEQEQDKEKEQEKEGEEENITTPRESAQRFFFMVQEETDELISFIAKLVEKHGGTHEYFRKEIKKFVNYWTEKTQSGTKQRWQTEKTFEVHRRLGTWFSNAPNFQGRVGNIKQNNSKGYVI